jgi:hypothetical protein
MFAVMLGPPDVGTFALDPSLLFPFGLFLLR